MKDIVDTLEKIEQFIYKILLWVLLIPKTIVQITLNPQWAPEYIEKELGEGKSRFDEYMSPVILLLVVALVPAVLGSFLPKYGVEVVRTTPADQLASRHLEFDATTKFISSATSNTHYEFIWSVQKAQTDDKGNFLSYIDYKPTIRHTDDDQVADPTAYTQFYKRAFLK